MAVKRKDRAGRLEGKEKERLKKVNGRRVVKE